MTMDDQANGTSNNAEGISNVEKRIAFYKQEIATLEASN